MNLRVEPDLKSALKYWEQRQKHDGYLMLFMIILSVYPIIHFLAAPSGSSRFVMILFLCGLVLACLRLMKSAAKVIVLRRLV